jgi:hypothetical protein
MREYGTGAENMSVISWGVGELANVVQFLAQRNRLYSVEAIAERLAVVSLANVAEFVDNYGTRQGTPQPLTAVEIEAARPMRANAESALGTLRLLDYNALCEDVILRGEALEAIAWLLKLALPTVDA